MGFLVAPFQLTPFFNKQVLLPAIENRSRGSEVMFATQHVVHHLRWAEWVGNVGRFPPISCGFR